MRITLAVLAFALVSGLSAQAITFTGDARADFAGAQKFFDPAGMDVGMPSVLASNISGWDVNWVSASYDQATDTLFVGIDTFGIMGDADGDGDPSGSSAGLISQGGIDNADLGNTESVAFSLDLDGDGNLDVVVGVPFRQDITAWQIAEFQGSIFAPSFAFGAPIPGVTSTVFGSPTAAAPDLEFTISNVSVLLDGRTSATQDIIGFHLYMGSLEDDGIGEDFVPGLVTQPIPVSAFPCFPIAGRFETKSVFAQPANDFTTLMASFVLPDGYGCCLMAALQENPTGTPIPVNGNPLVLIGVQGNLQSVFVTDLGIAPSTGNLVNCKDVIFDVRANVFPVGTTVYVQMFGYPVVDPTQPAITSNVIEFNTLN